MLKRPLSYWYHAEKGITLNGNTQKVTPKGPSHKEPTRKKASRKDATRKKSSRKEPTRKRHNAKM